MTSPPWRGEVTGHFPGVPAWGLATRLADIRLEHLDRFAGVTPEWAWSGGTGAGVRVCVLDSGVDGTHPDVVPLARSLVVEATDEGVAVAECEPTDAAGHGTACAGIIRALAPQAELTSVRVLGSGKTGTGDALLEGLRWAVEEGFDVVNMSLSTTHPRFQLTLHELADRAYFRRTTLVTAAHNMPVRSFPWTFASVVSVASHDVDDPRVHFYNPSPPAEFHARGLRVPVAWPGGGHIRSTGNSFAAPHIAGLCALVLGKHPWLTPFQLKTVLYLTAVNVAPSNGGSRHAPDDHDRTV